MEETLNILKNLSKSFEQFSGNLETTTQRINKIHNLVDEKLGMIADDIKQMMEFIEKEAQESNQMIKGLVDKTIIEINKFYEYFELEKVDKIIKDLKNEIKIPELKKTASVEELKVALSQIKEFSKLIKDKT